MDNILKVTNAPSKAINSRYDQLVTFMTKLVAGHTVTCEEQDVDRYGRVVAICHAGGTDIGKAMVHNGLALAYRRYSTDYVAEEDSAREAKRGMWQGAFVEPWIWRREN